MNLEWLLGLLVIGAIIAWHQHRISKLERAVRWFASHLVIDDRDIEKTPPPSDLRKLLENPDDQD